MRCAFVAYESAGVLIRQCLFVCCVLMSGDRLIVSISCLQVDNQRIKLALISKAWSEDPRYNGSNPVDGVPFLDAGVVGWNFRDRKIHGKPKMTFIKAHVRARVCVCVCVWMFRAQVWVYQCCA